MRQYFSDVHGEYPQADAAGREPNHHEDHTMTANPPTEAAILEALHQVIDPEINCNIVDLGLIYGVAIANGVVKVTMTLTTPGCPMHESISWGVKNAVCILEGVTDVDVEIVWDPPWNPSMMTEAGRAITGCR